MAYEQLSITDTYDALLSTTLRHYQPKLVDNIFRQLPLLFWLNDKGRKRVQDGGHSILEPLLYGENTTVKLYSGYDTLDVTPQEGITMSEWKWKSMAVSITISREDRRKNSGKYAAINLLEARTMQAEKSMQWYLNDLFHGRYSSHAKTFCGSDSNTVNSVGDTTADYIDSVDGSGKGFNSLDHIVRSGWGLANNDSTTAQSHVVGGITCTTKFATAGDAYADWGGTIDVDTDSAVNPWWLNYSNPGFRRLSRGAEGGVMGELIPVTEMDYAADCDGNSNQNIISATRSMYNRLSDGGDVPDLLLSGQEVFETYEGALMPLERFTDTRLGDAGFQNLRFKNATWIFDHGLSTSLPSGDPSTTALAAPLYLLNSKYLSWVVDADSDFHTTPFYRPENQAASTAQILLMGQLTCPNRSKHGVISCGVAADYTPA